MHTNSALKADRFRPVSMSDFLTYAKSMAWLCELPLQRAQEMLSRIYGYSGLHELQQTMKRPGEAGPFMHQWSQDALIPSTVGGQMYFSDPDLGGNRLYRMWDIVAAEKGFDRGSLPARLLRVTDLLLFDPPAQQREAYRQLRAILDVIDGNESLSHDRLPTEYAYLEEGRGGKYLAFTELGQNVFNAAMELVPDRAGRVIGGRSYEECTGKLEEIILRHPSNPWPRAIFICGYADYYFQGGWANKLHVHRDSGFDLDPAPGFEQHRVINAQSLLQDAQASIALFEELYGSHKGEAPDHRSYQPGADTFYWPAVLYFGGLIALNAGQPRLAKNWLALNHKLCHDDNFGARFYLAVIALNDGKPKVRPLFNNRDAWANILIAAEAARAGKYNEAAKLYGDAVADTWASIEAFAGYWKEARNCRVSSNIGTPAHLKELMVRTEPFWTSHPKAYAFFEAMAKNKELRQAALALHQHKSASFGSALREGVAYVYEMEEQRKRLDTEMKAVAVLAGANALATLGMPAQ